MKSFRSLIEATNSTKTRVLLFGRMNPVTKGHEENVNAAHAIAQKHNAELHVIASHSHDAKKNPLSPEQKATHLKRAFGHLSNTHVGTSSKESPTILHQAAAAHKAGVHHLIIAGGGDRAHEYHKLLNTYNGHEGGKHGYYKFKKISIENTGERKEGVSGTDMRKHAAAGHFDKFRAGLPSKLAGNEKHARAAFNDVRHGMGVHEDLTRESYIAGAGLLLGEAVIDNFTGMTGTIVYRGPTYVTVQIDEELSFKRWIRDVDTVEEQTTDIQGFKDHMVRVPADVKNYWMDRLHYCPGAQAAFAELIGNTQYEQGTVQAAIDSTAHYLNIEELAEKTQQVDDHAITEFNAHMRQASQLLDSLGTDVLAKHEPYMLKHQHAMIALAKKLGVSNLPEAKDIDLQGHMDLTDKDIKEIEDHIDQLEDKEFDRIYARSQSKDSGGQGDTIEEEFDEELDEGLSAQARIKKKFDFIKNKSKREMAAALARRRSSTSGKLKKKAISHARLLIMQRLLRGRKKSNLSATEKTRIEGILKKSARAVVRISNKLLPKLREAEARRLAHHREGFEGPIHDAEEEAYVTNTTAAHPKDTATQANKAKIAGVEAVKPTVATHGKTIARLKNFRKLEN